MQRLLFALVLTTVVAGSILSGGSRTPPLIRSAGAIPAGQIDSISPREGRAGDLVTIRGRGFGAQNVQIRVSGVTAAVVAATGDQVTFVVPDGALVGPGTVQATNPGWQAGEIAFRVLLRVRADSASAVSAAIGVSGGTVTAHRGGITYALTIPPGALDADTAITLTPIVSLSHLPFSNGIVAAGQFEPSGLTLHRTATLRITMPGRLSSAGLLGFVTDNDGRTLEIMKPDVAQTSVSIPVAHFSAGGVGSAAIADFERQIRPLLNAVPASLAPTQVDTLITAFVSWFDPQIFPDHAGFEICRQTSLCNEVLATAQTSLLQSQAAACAEAAAFLDRPTPEPFLARDAVAPVVHIAARLVELATLATAANIPGFESQLDLSCLADTFSRIVDAAGQMALDNPRIGPLMLMVDIASDAALLGLNEAQQHAMSTLASVIETLVDRAEQRCTADPDVGENLLDMILTNTTLEFLNGLDSGLGDRTHEVKAGCRVRIVPLAPSVVEDDTVLFAGNVVGVTPSTVVWSFASQPLGSTIDQLTGLFRAGHSQGTVEVLATSTARPELFKRTKVTIVDQCPQPPAEPEMSGPSTLEADAPVCIAVAPSAVNLVAGQTQQFTATVTGGTNQAVVWTATGGTITTTGLFTAGATGGTFSVRAASVIDASVFGEAAVTITGGAPIMADSSAQVAMVVINPETAGELVRDRKDAQNTNRIDPYPPMPMIVSSAGEFVALPPACATSSRCLPSDYSVDATAVTPIPPAFGMLPSIGVFSGEANCSAVGNNREVDGFLLMPELPRLAAEVRGDMTVTTSLGETREAPFVTLALGGVLSRIGGVGDLGGSVTILGRVTIERVSAGVLLPDINIDLRSYENLSDASALDVSLGRTFTVQSPGRIAVRWVLGADCQRPNGTVDATKAGSSMQLTYQITK